MPRTRCAFCDHDTPPGSKYCNECGSPLHLAPCAKCDAVNDVDARACHRCGAALQVRTENEARTSVAAVATPGAARAHVPEAFARIAESAAGPVAVAAQQAAAQAPQMPPAAQPQSPLRPHAPSPLSTPIGDTSAVAAPESFVVPPDEARLAATRGIAVAASRRRTLRNSVIAVVAVAALPVLYLEFFATDAVAQWLHRAQSDVASAIRSRLRAATATSSDGASDATAPTSAADAAGKAQPAPPASTPVPPALPGATPRTPPSRAEQTPATAQPSDAPGNTAPSTQAEPPSAASGAPVVPVNAGTGEATQPPSQ